MLGVVDGVGDQVAQDALDAARVDLGDHRIPGRSTCSSIPASSARCPTLPSALLTVDRRSTASTDSSATGVVAGDLQQVVEQRLEPVEFADEQLGRTAQRRIEIPLWS